MTEHGLQLALAKTEVVMLIGNRIETIVPLHVGTQEIRTKPSAVYLGVTIDTKLKFTEHIRKATEKASLRVGQLSRLMANTHGPKPMIRRLLMSTIHSILLYGAEVWADALRVNRRRVCMAAVQRRGALRIACSYRTVSEAAVVVISNVIPIDLLAFERKRIYEKTTELGKIRAAREARANTLDAWQQRWDEETKGRWTHRLIPSRKQMGQQK